MLNEFGKPFQYGINRVLRLTKIEEPLMELERDDNHLNKPVMVQLQSQQLIMAEQDQKLSYREFTEFEGPIARLESIIA